MSLSARLLAQLSEVALRDAAAAVDPAHCPDETEGAPPLRSVTLADVEESRRLVDLSAHLLVSAMLQGFPCDDPFLSDEEIEEWRVETWDRVLP